MSSPCGNCRSLPCACPPMKITLEEGRYSFHQHVCLICKYQPCTCGTSDATFPSHYCAICFCNPCLCATEGPEITYVLSCGCLSDSCKCSAEEPREFHDIMYHDKNKDNWVHRSMSMRCGTCVEKAQQADPMLAVLGRCRKHAPTLDGWPAVYNTDWCGDHKLDEAKT
jgi:hypothetical protein